MGEPRLRADVLGVPVVTVDGSGLAVDTRKATAVLAVLVVAASRGVGEISRSELAALLWPDADEARARGALRRTLSVLVAASGDAVFS